MSESKDKTQNGATKAKIKVNNHPEFPATDSGTVMSTIDMDKMFKSLIGGIFKDTFGLRPSWNLVTNRLTVSAYFDQGKQNPDDIVAFKMNGIDGHASGYSRIAQLNNLQTSSSMFTLTDDAKEALAPFMADEAKNRDGSIRWNDLDVVAQAVDPNSSYGQNKVYNVIHFLNPVALLNAIYGDEAKVVETDKDGVDTIVKHNVAYTIEVLGIQINNTNSFNTPFQYYADPMLQQQNPMSYDQVIKQIVVDPCIVRISQIDAEGVERATGRLGLRYRNSLGIDQ